MYKVFVNDKPLILTDDFDDYSSEKGIVFMKYNSPEGVAACIEQLELGDFAKGMVIHHDDLPELWKTVQSFYTIVEAAGGLVKNDSGQTLFISRNGKWDLPKGKVEQDEDVAQAAIREVEEECSLAGVKITKEICTTYHTYRGLQQDGAKDDEPVLKRTQWFEMTCYAGTQPMPQTEEGITKVEWFSADALDEVRANTYESIKELINSQSL